MAAAPDTDPIGLVPFPAPRPPRVSAGEIDGHPLLVPLAEAQDAVARLEATAATASAAVVEGLRARVAYREAAGWLAHTHTWIHPRDLALRDAGLTGSYTAAALAGRLDAELPTMTADGQRARHGAIGQRGRQRAPPGAALAPARRAPHLAAGRRCRRRCGKPSAPWAGRSRSTTRRSRNGWTLAGRPDRGPALIRAGHGARDWMNRQGHTDPLATDGLFLAACLWRDAGFGRDIPLPFWSAPVQLHHRLSLRVGTEWLAGFLACVAAASRAAREELAGLQRAETAGAALARTARSHLPRALDHVLRYPGRHRARPGGGPVGHAAGRPRACSGT